MDILPGLWQEKLCKMSGETDLDICVLRHSHYGNFHEKPLEFSACLKEASVFGIKCTPQHRSYSIQQLNVTNQILNKPINNYTQWSPLYRHIHRHMI